jgi:hemerythrin-like domain-containing protein
MVMPIGPLMIEHRLIERMIDIIKLEISNIEKRKDYDPQFIDKAVDFIQVYADRCHHGKEEDILFRDLKNKKLTDKHRKIMEDLIEEHKWARTTTKKLVRLNKNYKRGDEVVLREVIRTLKEMVKFYPEHIDKEDNHFFLPIMKYFTETEQEDILEEEYKFDRKLIHDIYKDSIKKFEEQYK